jgi:hypothetical protein
MDAYLQRRVALNGHRMEVKWARKQQDLPTCQILFMSRSAAKRYDKALDAARNSGYPEITDLLQASGIVSLQSAGHRSLQETERHLGAWYGR